MMNRELVYSVSVIQEGTVYWLLERRRYIAFACRFQRRYPTVAEEEN
jgi:hypothetical protein